MKVLINVKSNKPIYNVTRIVIEHFYAFSDINLKEPWKREDDSEERNLKARKAYEALLTVTARTPDNDEYKQFSNEIKSLAKTRYNFTFGNASVTTFVTAFYDAVLLYARALNESLTDFPDNINIDGANLTRRMWGASFKGILIKFIRYFSDELRKLCLFF